ncbi:melanoma-associated antigen B5-like [Pteropus vampyrus]|uniref:Melanoma-associated antigen B5-like n=1 Tax=Pteropus vampyrus TaxID=132908 RepID=A0A6P6C628_PTEVA|nr:melanoma-associated antigen B5-like [Pteropus vampyrus]
MPRGQKSKLRAREKRRQARNKSHAQRSDEAAAMEEELPSCSSALEAPSQSASPTESGSCFRASRRASATTTTTSQGAVKSSSDDSEESQDEAVSYSPEVFPAQSSESTSLTVKVDLVEQFLMYKYRVNQPILKKDIEKILGERHQDRYAEILKKAAERIEVVFAIDLKAVDSTKHLYEFVSKLKIPNNGRMRLGGGWPKTGLLMNILGFIFMKGNRASEEDLWEFLNMLQIYPGKKHIIYGEPRKLISKDLVNLKYLEYRQVPGSDPPHREYLWGPRAYAETSKIKVLHFLAKAGTMVPSALPQYEEALQEERAHTRDAGRAGTSATARPDSMAPSSSTRSAH